MDKFIYDTYKIKLPGDVYDNKEDFLDLAIREAKERTTLFVVPCEWKAEFLAGEIGDSEIVIKVVRKRQNKKTQNKITLNYL